MNITNDNLKIILDNLNNFSTNFDADDIHQKLLDTINNYKENNNCYEPYCFNRQKDFEQDTSKVILATHLLESLLEDKEYIICNLVFRYIDNGLYFNEYFLKIPTKYFLIEDLKWKEGKFDILNLDDVEGPEELEIVFTLPKGKQVIEDI